MLQIEDVKRWRGASLVDRNGDRIGSIDEIYLDPDTGEPEWLAVKTGLFGGKLSFVPLAQATPSGDDVEVPFKKAHVKDAPRVDADGELSREEEARLYSHYGVEYGESRSDTGLPEGEARGTGVATHDESRVDARGADPASGGDPAGTDVSGPETDDAMTRSEEELHVGTARRERGRVRLRKYVETEHVTRTIPVQREEVRIEREPITDANADAALDGPEISEEEHEIVLHEEEPVVEKRVVPKERVRLGKDTRTGEQEVSDAVRREQVDVLDAEGRPPHGIDGGRGTDEGVDR